MSKNRRRDESRGYQIFILMLSLFSLGMIAAQTLFRFSPGTNAILDCADVGVCVVFLGDFVHSLVESRRNWLGYLRTWGWLDLLSSIPTLDVGRWGRIARVARVFRMLRGVRASQVLASLAARKRAENALLAAVFVAAALVVFCSIGVLHFETHPDSNIRTADDALWWAFATITTVGFGDRYPVTGEGRFVATILMAAGLALFGTFSGFLAQWFLGRKDDAEIELAEVRKELAALNAKLSAPGVVPESAAVPAPVNRIP